MTVGDIEKVFSEQLSGLYDESESKHLAYYAIEHICQLSRAQLMVSKAKELEPLAENSLLMLLDELQTGKPIQYIIGETEFYRLPFKVTPAVLIPRQETEELVSWVLEETRHRPANQSLRILDIGTGSGCIPITLKKHLPKAEVQALDISFAALEVAMHNAVLNQTEVKFYQADIFLSSAISSTKGFDVIISNPPYIAMEEKGEMHENVLNHEPHQALFVEDTDPLLFYKQIAQVAIEHLQPKGLLFFEINERYGSETIELLKNKSFNKIELRKDLMGKDRMIKAEK